MPVTTETLMLSDGFTFNIFTLFSTLHALLLFFSVFPVTAFYFLSMDEFYIRNEIMTYGPVSASVGLFSDFLEKPDGTYYTLS